MRGKGYNARALRHRYFYNPYGATHPSERSFMAYKYLQYVCRTHKDNYPFRGSKSTVVGRTVVSERGEGERGIIEWLGINYNYERC